ncbi:MAG: hypothetical protein NZ930_07540 [Candidatus Bipolaricaulota bacterium]|nr:hypothetical protein [Candidatus Bipolaricaulota bacterium]MDW8030322.1 hypothetical protein [Candidatus Bipolaricaulota bacterium]
MRTPHSWLRSIEVAFVPPSETMPLAERVWEGLERAFRQCGHRVVPTPQASTDIVLTAAPFGEAIPWRTALLFTMRRRYRLPHMPLLWTIVPVTPERWHVALQKLEHALAKELPDPSDFAFPGLAQTAWRTLIEQGRRGGPILALQRAIQAQVKSIRVLLVVGHDYPIEAYLFDLMGGYPRIPADDSFYTDLVLRMATIASTYEVTEHQAVGAPIPAKIWQALEAPAAMKRAAREFGQRDFFTPGVRISELVTVPAVEASISAQYSEGCFATWEPALGALVTTITGSARPVAKDAISDDDLAVIVGVRPDGKGALVRPIEGTRNDPPSSEAVELYDMDSALPKIAWNGVQVPVVRSKLHGHRGVRAYDPTQVEFVPLDPPFYYYPVACATAAQAQAIKTAFARSQALQDPEDPRTIVFTVLPCHGVVIVEKWVTGKAPFQAIWEAMDDQNLVIDALVPQGPFDYELTESGLMVLREPTSA